MAHLITHRGQTFSPDGKVNVSAEEVETINKAADAAELAIWAERPTRFSPAYYTFPAEDVQTTSVYGAPITLHMHTLIYRQTFVPPMTDAVVKTWNGSLLGRITSAKVFGHNFGGRMVAITVRGTNGASYYGRASWDNGNVIRLRKVKE